MVWRGGAVGLVVGAGGGAASVVEGASVYSTVAEASAQSIPASTWTAIDFNAEAFDDNDYHSTVSNTSRLTVPADGLYLFGGGARLEGASSSMRVLVQLAINGTRIAPSAESYTVGSSYFSGDSLSQLRRLSTSDYIELFVLHTNAAARDLLQESISLWVVRLA